MGSLVAMVSPQADARPVSYPGGWTIMQQNNGDFSSVHVHYSPTFQDSVGLYAESNWAEDFSFAGVQYNRLLKRWNGDNSQANLYFKAAAGGAQGYDADDVDGAGFVGIAADWETRRWFASYEGRAWRIGEKDLAKQAVRAGVAPYVGDYGDLHTWLMVEVENNPTAEESVTTTPLVRFFKGVQMVELGWTLETETPLVNWIYRF